MDRIERHDAVNAVGLALVLLAMAFGLVLGARALFDTVNGGLVTADQPAETETPSNEAANGTAVEEPTPDETVDETVEPPVDTTATTELTIRPPSEVTVRVGNGARRAGVAGAGTDLLTQAGYPSLGPKNAPSVENSVVYYVEGYQGDAIQVSRLLNLGDTAIAPMPADPGIEIESAQLVIILGSDWTLG